MPRLLFEVGHLYHRAALDPLYEVFRQDPSWEISWSCPHDAEKRFLIFNRSLRPALEARFRAEGLQVTRETRGFDVVITGDTVREPGKYGETLLCFVNHGTGIKNVLYRNLRSQPETRYQVFVEGQYRVDKLNESGTLGLSEVHKVGLPKLDPVFRPGYPSRASILEKLGLDPAKKTVLFAPTYKPTCLDVVRESILSETTGWNLIIKLHQYSWRGKYAPHWHHEIYEKAMKQYDHAVLIPPDDYNIVPYQYASDTVVSEASSTIFDYVAFDKIGVVFVIPNELHSDGMSILTEDPEHFLEDCFVHVRDPKDLRAAITDALRDDPARKERARTYRDRFFHGLDGQAAHRTKQTIERLLAEGTHRSRPLQGRT